MRTFTTTLVRTVPMDGDTPRVAVLKVEEREGNALIRRHYQAAYILAGANFSTAERAITAGLANVIRLDSLAAIQAHAKGGDVG